jgi:prephenate dehydrogenase
VGVEGGGGALAANHPVPEGRPPAGEPAGASPAAERICIVGLGLIGGSLGLAWRRRGACREVVGVARSPEAAERARAVGAVDRATAELEAGVAGADVVVLATPVAAALELAPRVAAAVAPGTLVTDVCGSKQAICRAFEGLLPEGAAFVGGHPMAGSERAGLDAADAYLFENAVYVLTPGERTPQWAVRRMEALVRALGAHPVRLDPARHDAWVAVVSHLPQMVAVALVNAAADAEEDDPGLLALAGGGFRDTTRIASSPPEVWMDVLATNAPAVVAALDRFLERAAALRSQLARGDREAIAAAFRRAAAVRARVPARTKGLLPAYHDLVLFVPDRPGVIGRLATALGDRGVNIQDIEILRLREGEGGTLRLGFATRDEAERARAVLAELGVTAVLRGG